MLIWSYTPHMLIYAHCPMPCEPRWAWERKPEAAPAWHISVPNSQLMQKWETPSVPIIYYIKCIKTKHQPAIDAMCIQRIWPQRRARARERRERERKRIIINDWRSRICANCQDQTSKQYRNYNNIKNKRFVHCEQSECSLININSIIAVKMQQRHQQRPNGSTTAVAASATTTEPAR